MHNGDAVSKFEILWGMFEKTRVIKNTQNAFFALGMAQGIPRSSFLEVWDLFSLLDTQRN